MNSRNKMILSGVITVALAMLVTQVPVVVADSFPVGAAPGNSPPEIFLLKKIFDICNPNTGSGLGDTGGSTPDGFDAQVDGCVDTKNEERVNEYAFTGEQILELVAVRDLNGALDILTAHGTVGGAPEVKCNDITAVVVDLTLGDPQPSGSWRTHSIDLTQIPAKGPVAPNGFDRRFDKIYECVLTVEPGWSGESTVNIEAFDQAGSVTTDGIAQTWFFNPAIIIDLSTNDGAASIEFEDSPLVSLPGSTVYSTNKLVITNLAEGGVDLVVFIAADDLTDPSSSAVKCPISNVLEVDQDPTVVKPLEGMDYRCKVGTVFDQEWNDITNKDPKDSCDPHIDFDDSFSGTCHGARPLVDPDNDQSLSSNPSILFNGHEAECQFRLTYPVPCIGDFSEGMIHIIVRAI